MDLDVFRQDRVVQLPGLFFDPIEYDLGLFPGPHEDHAFHGLVALVEPELTEARRFADHDLADVFDQYRRSVVDRHDDVADVFGRGQAAEAADVVELAALGVEAASGVAVVGAQRVDDQRDREPDRGDFGRIEQHLILHCGTAEAGVVGHAGNRLVLSLR